MVKKRRVIRGDSSDEDVLNSTRLPGASSKRLEMTTELSSINPPSSALPRDDDKLKPRHRFFEEDEDQSDEEAYRDEVLGNSSDDDNRSESKSKRKNSRGSQSDASSVIRTDNEEEAEKVARASADEDADKENTVDVKMLERLAKSASKTVVRKPRPKLDPIRLLGEKGLPGLLESCKRTKFLGKGHEFADFDRVMFVYEAWAHQLFPKLTMDAIIDRLEVLGTKREVYNRLRRARLGDDLDAVKSAEFVSQQDDDDDDNEVAEQEKRNSPAPDEFEDRELLHELDMVESEHLDDKWQRMLDAEDGLAGKKRSRVPLDDLSDEDDDDDGDEREDKNKRAAPAPVERQMIAGPSTVRLPDGVTDEMLREDEQARVRAQEQQRQEEASLAALTGMERAERNRMLALERLKAKQRQSQLSTS